MSVCRRLEADPARVHSWDSILRLGAVHSPVQELWAGDDALDQGPGAVALARQAVAHGVDDAVVRGEQAAPEGVGQQLAAQVLDEFPPALLAEVRTQAVDPDPLDAPGECRAGVDGPA